MVSNLPKISFIIPTLNAQRVLKTCLDSIKKQDYPKKYIEIIIADGGSDDNTVNIAKNYHSLIVKNPLKTAESGKAIGLSKASGELFVLLDSDNILPDKSWLKKMIKPLCENQEIIGSEPWRFTYRPKSGIIERYSALIGANDPYAFITKVYDRKNFINDLWTGLDIKQIDKSSYLELELTPKTKIPTIGANGTIFRREFLINNLKTSYLFDIDIISQVLNTTNSPLKFAKVKIGIIHTYCENSFLKFIRKQNRRLTDYYTYKEFRTFSWENTNKNGILKFTLYSLLIFPAFFDSIRGFFKKPDIAWFIHPLSCLATFFIYATTTLKYKLGLLKPLNRLNWNQ